MELLLNRKSWPGAMVESTAKVSTEWFTFQAAGSPQSRVGHHFFVFPACFVFMVDFGFTHSSGVKPVVCANCDGHEAEGGKSAHCSDEHLHASVTQQHLSACKTQTYTNVTSQCAAGLRTDQFNIVLLVTDSDAMRCDVI